MRPPIELRPPEAVLVLPAMFLSFFSLLALVLGAAAGLPLPAAAGALALAGSLLLFQYQKRCVITLKEDRLIVSVPFSRTVCLYADADLLLLRRSRSRRRWTAGLGLQDVAARLQKGNRVLAVIPASWREARNFEAAMSFLESLPLPKKYL